jgi:hypothetical protein
MVCVPLTPAEFDTFEPSQAPVIGELIAGLNQGETNGSPAYSRALKTFDGFVKKLETSIRKERIEKQESEFKPCSSVILAVFMRS